MKLEQLNSWIALLANLGVVAGILLLALEIQQNNELLAAQARMYGEQNRMRDEMIILGNPDLRGVIVKLNQGLELSPEEALLNRVFKSTVLNGWQATWLEFQAGLIEIDGHVDRWRNIFWYQEYLDRWEDTKHRYRAEFVAWMEENVVSDPPE